MLLKHKVISGVIWNTVNASAVFLISLGTIVILARLLKPEDFGMYAMITVVIGMLESFADMGVSAAIISYQDIDDKELSSLFALNILIGFLLALLLLAFSPLIVYFFKEPKIYVYLWVLSLNFIITAPASIFNVLMKKNMKFETLSKINIVSSVAYAIGTIGYAFFRGGIMSFVVGVLIQSIISTILNIYFGSKLWKPEKISIRFIHIKRFLSFGLYQMGQRLLNRFNWNIDYLLIGRFLGAEALGYYSLAYNLMLKPFQKIIPIIANVAFPVLSEIQNDTERLKLYFLKMIRYTMLVLAPLYFIFFVLSEDIIVFLYGDKWILSAPVLTVFSLLGILYSLGNPGGYLILAKGRADIGFWLNISQTLLLLIANYIGLGWGIVGVALSTLFVTFFIFSPIGFFIRYYLVKMLVLEYLNQIKKPLFFSFISAVIIFLLRSLTVSLGTLWVLLILCGIFVSVYSALLFVFDKREMVFLKKTMNDYFNKKEEKCVE